MVHNVANDVWQISGFPPHAINAYRVGDVLIDCGTRWDARMFLRVLAGSNLTMVALTHCHPDHQGSARKICEAFKCPLACHEADRAAMEGREPMGPPTRAIRFSSNLIAGPPHPVERCVRDGDEIAGFRVIHAPGHTAGHVIYFRERDGIAITGDLFTSMNLMTMVPGLHEPPGFFSVDRAQNRRSIRAMVALEPKLVLPGHGPPVSDIDALRAFAARMD